MLNPYDPKAMLAGRGMVPTENGVLSKLNPFSWNDESQSTVDKRQNLNNQGGASSVFADQGQQGFGALGQESAAQRDQMRRLASGQDSMSAEQLRQGMQSNLAQQRSMAAGASPANSAMAARTAAINSGRISSGMNGQAAMAGIQERTSAQAALAQMIAQQRQMELQAALGGRQNAIAGYGGASTEGTALESALPFVNAFTGAFGAAFPGGKKAG